jgi:hypothetical protein
MLFETVVKFHRDDALARLDDEGLLSFSLPHSGLYRESLLGKQMTVRPRIYRPCSPRAGLPFSADTHLSVLENRCDCV